MKKSVWIVDFGSQYTQLITRRTREIGHSSEIITFSELKRRWDRNEKPKALVLSGGLDRFQKMKMIIPLYLLMSLFLF